MNDELLMKFIDGKTTPEETEVVVAYLSAHPEEAQEWMQMEVAARLADTRPVVAVSETDAEKSVAGRVRPKVIRLRWVIGAVTAVAASVAAVVMFDFKSEAPGVKPPLVSEVVDDSVQTEMCPDTLYVEKVPPVAGEYVAETVVENNPVEEKIETRKSVVEPLTVSKIEKSTASSQSAAGSVSVLRPAKSPYRIRVKNPEKDFVFEWQGENITSVVLEVKDSNGERIVCDEVSPDVSAYPVKSGYLMNRGVLKWALKVCFSDGVCEIKSGEIELVGDVN